MVVHKISFSEAETYYFKTMFDSYDNFRDFFKKTTVYKNTPSEKMFKKMKKDEVTKKLFKSYYDKGVLDEYYTKYDWNILDLPQISDEEEEKVEEENHKKLKKKEKEEKEEEELQKDIKMIFEGAYQPHHINDEYINVLEMCMDKKLKTYEEYIAFKNGEVIKVKEEKVVDFMDNVYKKEVAEEKKEEEIDIDYVSNNVIDYDPNILITEQPLTKKEMTIQCDMIVRSIVEDAIKNGKEVKSINDDEMKECENCANYEMDCMLFEDKYHMCKICYDDIDVGRFYMKRYFELQEQIYDVSKKKLEGMKKENKIVKITDKGKKKTKYKKAKCNGHNPTKSNDDKFNELMCKCRIWNEGYGGQCQSKPSGEEDMCKTHFKKVKKLREEWSDTLGWWFGYYNEDRCDSLEELFPNDEVCDYIDFLPKTVRSGAVSRGNSGGSDFKWK